MAIIEAGLPAPKPQHWVKDRGVPRFRLDLAYPLSLVAVEYDGRAYHGSRERMAADKRRREWLRSRGWTIIVVTSESFTLQALLSWTNELAAALRRA